MNKIPEKAEKFASPHQVLTGFFRLLIILPLLFAMACSLSLDNGDDDDKDKNSSGIDFSSHNTDYSILVRNNTGERLVAFKGELQPDRLVGGIPAHAQNHGMPKIPALFDKTEDFPLILLTESQYNANKSNLASQKNTPFTRIYIFFNANGENTLVYEIAAGLGGTNELHIINSSTSLNIELRVNGVAGETLGYAPAGILDTTLYLTDGDYNIFPVFKRYNRTRDVPETVYPEGSSGYSWFQMVGFDDTHHSYTLNLRDALRNATITSGAAWVVVNNQTTAGGIRFMEGGIVHKTATRGEAIMDDTAVQIDMPKIGLNFQESKTVNNWAFGPPGFEAPLQNSADDPTPRGAFEIEVDKMYVVTVIGDHNSAVGIHAYISRIQDIDSAIIDGYDFGK